MSIMTTGSPVLVLEGPGPVPDRTSGSLCRTTEAGPGPGDRSNGADGGDQAPRPAGRGVDCEAGPALVPEVLPPLQDLRARIADEHGRFEGSFRAAVGHAVRAGELLLQVKAQLRHGQYKAWVEENCPFRYRTAALYARLARSRPALESTPGTEVQPVAHLTVRSADQSLRRPRRRTASAGPAADVPGPGDTGDAAGQASPDASGSGTAWDSSATAVSEAEVTCSHGESEEHSGVSTHQQVTNKDASRQVEAIEARSTTRDAPGGPVSVTTPATEPATPPESIRPTHVPAAGGRERSPLRWAGVTEPGEAEALSEVYDQFQEALRAAAAAIRCTTSDPFRSRRMAQAIRPYFGQVEVLIRAVSPQAWAACDRCGGRGVMGGDSPCRDCGATGWNVIY